jgi:hypothetical protein
MEKEQWFEKGVCTTPWTDAMSSLHKVHKMNTYECVFKSFRTGRLERELQVVQLSATRWSCIAILWVSLVSFAAINLCVASQRVFIVISLSTQSGNFWIHPQTTEVVPLRLHVSSRRLLIGLQVFMKFGTEESSLTAVKRILFSLKQANYNSCLT